ncbi:hypothetical protein [Sphaerotilus microaerophilus]|uniref:Lipoprotein n=1 Tax=Sphaerotilus microaerophilus TaxID=2914710 RepID=A0ABN6PLD1_9BURK|nr:hypothetical protein [Sphaerotilus sp. FB-5]BDI04843.1 hypothetical protein CATMQ487_18130 [Sphaerotilus sp. FB-5]
MNANNDINVDRMRCATADPNHAYGSLASCLMGSARKALRNAATLLAAFAACWLGTLGLTACAQQSHGTQFNADGVALSRWFASHEVWQFFRPTGNWRAVRGERAEPPGEERFVFQLDSPDPKYHYLVVVEAVPAGRFIDAPTYERQKLSDLAADPGAVADYPTICLRAKRRTFGFGPGGALYGMDMTLPNGKSDIRITVSNRMSASIEPPSFDMDGFAMWICTHSGAD